MPAQPDLTAGPLSDTFSWAAGPPPHRAQAGMTHAGDCSHISLNLATLFVRDRYIQHALLAFWGSKGSLVHFDY